MVEKSVLRKKMEEFEDGFPDGVYAVPPSPKEPILNVPKMYAYCKEHNIKPDKLSKKEMEQFLEYK